MNLPIVDRVDVVVIGGTIRGVAAAIRAAEHGSRTLLVAPGPFPGEDLCDTLRLWRPAGWDGSAASCPITAQLFLAGAAYTTPMRVKRTLAQALLDAGVNALLNCFVTDLLVDDNSKACGVILANRAGRQAIFARAIVDATDRAAVVEPVATRIAPWPTAPLRCSRVVIGGCEPRSSTGITDVRHLPGFAQDADGTLDAYEYTLDLAIPYPGIDSFCAAEQEARDRTYRPGQLRASDRLSFVQPDPIACVRTAEGDVQLDGLDPRHFMPQGVGSAFILGPRADVPRLAAIRLLDPDISERVGGHIGAAAAQAARDAAPRTGAPRISGAQDAQLPGAVRVQTNGLRPTSGDAETIEAQPTIRSMRDVDVVVVGGGTAGISAAIAAARQGRSVLLAEVQAGVGGTGTLGLITRPYHGLAQGFAREITWPGEGHTVEDKMEALRTQLRKAGGEIWLGVTGCGAIADGTHAGTYAHCRNSSGERTHWMRASPCRTTAPLPWRSSDWETRPPRRPCITCSVSRACADTR